MQNYPNPAKTEKVHDEDFFDDEDDLEVESKAVDIKETKENSFKWLPILLIFLGALAVRLYSLFFITDPQNAGINWYPDVYHHWQIGYLTKEIGLSEGLTRLWDLKGLEYFWGMGHPYILVILFTITGSVNILIPRLLDVFLGSLSIVLLYKIVKTYFNYQVALASSVLAAFNPISIFSDASGMQEPVGIFFLLSSIFLIKKNRFLAGLVLFIAGTRRAEFWVFGLGLVLVHFILEKKFEEKLIFAFGWAVPSLIYMKILLDRTGNPIYPIWWNFLGNAFGVWQAPVSVTAIQMQARLIYGALLVLAVLGAILVFYKRPKAYLFWFLGFGNIIFLSSYIGFSQYLKSYLPRFWIDRIMIFPYIFLGFILSLFLLGFIADRVRPWRKLYVGWIFVLGLLLVSQVAWQPILFYYNSKTNWENEKVIARSIGKEYKGGKVLLPEDRPPLTYMLANYENIQGKNMQGQMYDQFAYIPGDPYENWDKNRKIVLDWLNKNDIKLIVFYNSRERYKNLVEREKDKFELVEKLPQANLLIYRVK